MISTYNNIPIGSFDFVPSYSITPNDFIIWLKGYRDISLKESVLSQKQIEIIWEKLDKCEANRFPHNPTSSDDEIGYQKLFTGHTGITAAAGLC